MSRQRTPQNKVDKKKIGKKLAYWFLFSVFFASLPLLLKTTTILNRGLSLSLMDIGSKGEFLILSAAISSAAIGEVVANGNKKIAFAKVMCCSGSILALILASFFFGDISAASISNDSYEIIDATNRTVAVFGWAILSGAGCMAIAEVR